MIEVLQILAIVSVTATMSYLLTRHLMRKEHENKFQKNLVDINYELKQIKKMKDSLDSIPYELKKHMDINKNELMAHTEMVSDNLRKNIIDSFENRLDAFDIKIQSKKETSNIDPQLFEKIEVLMNQKMDNLMDKMEASTPEPTQIPSAVPVKMPEMKDYTDDFERLNHLMSHLVKMVEKLEHGGNKEDMLLVNQKLERLLNKEPTIITKEIEKVIPIDRVASRRTVARTSTTKKKATNKAKAKTKKVARKTTKKAVAKKRDDLTQIKGIGKFVQRVLNRKFKIRKISDIANLDSKQIKEINKSIYFYGKVQREKWKHQARKIIRQKLTTKSYKARKKAA
jgi:predicted flap endonuclease-1-like 5' DNA nuclease